MFGFGKKAQIIAIDETSQARSEGLRWLAEMEMINDPAFLNAIILNIYKVHPFIKDAELINDAMNKKMLIWLKLEGWFLRDPKKERIANDVKDMLTEVLPSYKIKVIADKPTFDKALTIVRDKAVKLV